MEPHSKTHVRTLEEMESRLLDSASTQDKMEKICKRGDIVLLKDEASFQHSWPMGRVSKTYPGPDNKHNKTKEIRIS